MTLDSRQTSLRFRQNSHSFNWTSFFLYHDLLGFGQRSLWSEHVFICSSAELELCGRGAVTRGAEFTQSTYLRRSASAVLEPGNGGAEMTGKE